MQEYLQQVLSGQVPHPPVARFVGFRLIEATPGLAAVEFRPQAEHANAMGTLHGGILCDVADGAMGMALASLVPQGQSFTTLELKINYLRAVPLMGDAETLRAQARVVQAGRQVALVECDIIDPQGRLVARASSTCLIRSA